MVFAASRYGGHEYARRAGTFLYSSLAATVARVFWLNQVRVNENGVVGLNHPISRAVGAAQRAQPIPHALSARFRSSFH